MFTTLLFASGFAKFQLWQLDEPLTFNIPTKLATAGSKQLVTQDQMNNGLHRSNCSKFVNDHPLHLANSEKCWSYDYSSTPKGCPSTGWVKYDDFHFVEAKVGKAGVSVDEHNHVGLTVSEVSFKLKPTKFTAQEHGFFTIPCSGIIDGVISGATNAIEALVNLTAEGVPIIGEAAASPVDGVVVNLKHTLEGACAFLDDVVEDLIKLCGDLLGSVIKNDLPPIVQKLLEQILKIALANDGSGTTAAPKLAEGPWSRVF